MMNDEVKRETKYWLDKRAKALKRETAANKEVTKCMERFFSLDPESVEGKKAKAEWEFAVANLAKMDIENKIEALGPAILSLLSMGTDPDDVTSFMIDKVEEIVVIMAAKLLHDRMKLRGAE